MVGIFDPQLNPLAWFDESLVPEGWFDSDLILLPTLPLLAAFLALKPDYPHPQHHHDDLVLATADFLALAVFLAAALKRLRALMQPEVVLSRTQQLE